MMQVSARWLRMSGLLHSTVKAYSGIADLRHYNAAYTEWGNGPPLLILPGLAGGIDLIEPLACQLANEFHVIAVESRGERDSFALRQRFGLTELANDLAEFISW